MEAALDWADAQAAFCPGCGELRSESMDPLAEEAPGRPPKYVSEPVCCFACAAREQAAHPEQTVERAGFYYTLGKTR